MALFRRHSCLFAFQLLAMMTLSLSSLPAPTQASNGPGTTYLYDAEGRVIQATISNGTQSVTIFYTYDQAGNLVSVATR
jgi:YD repeat-containing protein